MLIILNYYTMYIRIKTSHISLQMSTINIISMTKISIFFSVINISSRVEFLYVMCTEAQIHSLLQSQEPDQVCSCWAPAAPLSLHYSYTMLFCCSSLSYNWHRESLLWNLKCLQIKLWDFLGLKLITRVVNATNRKSRLYCLHKGRKQTGSPKGTIRN